MKTPLKKNHNKLRVQIESGMSCKDLAEYYKVSRQAVSEYVGRHFTLNRSCEICGGSLKDKSWNAKYCSKCHPKQKATYECVCEHCGETNMKVTPMKFCSTKCRGLFHVKFDTGDILRRYKAGETIKEIAESLDTTYRSLLTCLYRDGIKLTEQLRKICPMCKSEFGGTNLKKYCSPECQKGAKSTTND